MAQVIISTCTFCWKNFRNAEAYNHPVKGMRLKIAVRVGGEW